MTKPPALSTTERVEALTQALAMELRRITGRTLEMLPSSLPQPVESKNPKKKKGKANNATQQD